MTDSWQPDFITRLPLFESLTSTYPADWPTCTAWPTIADYNQYLANAETPIINSNGQPIYCVSQIRKSQAFMEGYEPRIYLHGELMTRVENWHDFFNMLVWRTLPKIKAAMNAWQYQLLKQRLPAQTKRTPLENILTHLDENGVIVVSSDPVLIELLKMQRWQDLFWRQRAAVKANMRFFILGHALYEKSLNPYIGMTGSGIAFTMPADFFSNSLTQQLQAMDMHISACLAQESWLKNLTKLLPVPILGIPDVWPANADYHFYENKNYFREKISDKC